MRKETRNKAEKIIETRKIHWSGEGTPYTCIDRFMITASTRPGALVGKGRTDFDQWPEDNPGPVAAPAEGHREQIQTFRQDRKNCRLAAGIAVCHLHVLADWLANQYHFYQRHLQHHYKVCKLSQD